MPLTVAGMTSAIESELDAASSAVSAATGESGSVWRHDFAVALATAVVDYIKANALVTGTATCSTGGGPVTGTIS